MNYGEKPEGNAKWCVRALSNLIILPVIQGMFFTLGYFLAKYRLLPLILNNNLIRTK